jgi:hypothetical protein
MEKRSKLWVLLGALFFGLFNYPLLNIVNRNLCWGDVPVVIYYLFGVWLLAIGILFWSKRFLSP